MVNERGLNTTPAPLSHQTVARLEHPDSVLAGRCPANRQVALNRIRIVFVLDRKPGCPGFAVSTTATLSDRTIDVALRHKVIQRVLYNLL